MPAGEFGRRGQAANPQGDVTAVVTQASVAAAGRAAMRQFADILSVRTHGRGLVEVTPDVVVWTARCGLRTGLLTLFCRHTSASLVIQENAAPEVRSDLEAYFDRIALEDPHRYATLTTTKGPTTCPRKSAPR